MTYLQWVWYKDEPRVPFEFYDDSKGYLQIDKCGHMFGSYLESYYSYTLLRGAGVDRKRALIYGAPLGLILQTPIEVWDGLYEGWGFSWSDMAANAAGSALVVGNELLFREQLVKMKFSFRRSPYARQAHGYLGDTELGSLFLDYNGHSYLLSVPLRDLTGIDELPPWLCLSAGYSANGMFGEFRNRAFYQGKPIPETTRYRQYLLSLDVDWTRIRTRSRFVKTLTQALFWVKLPFPALEINTLGRVRGYGLYW